jgi:hypothetical protein
MDNVQSVLFDRGQWGVSGARRWLRDRGLAGDGKLHVTDNYLRFRQRDPYQYERSVTRRVGNGVQAIVGVYP